MVLNHGNLFATPPLWCQFSDTFSMRFSTEFFYSCKGFSTHAQPSLAAIYTCRMRRIRGPMTAHSVQSHNWDKEPFTLFMNYLLHLPSSSQLHAFQAHHGPDLSSASDYMCISVKSIGHLQYVFSFASYVAQTGQIKRERGRERDNK